MYCGYKMHLLLMRHYGNSAGIHSGSDHWNGTLGSAKKISSEKNTTSISISALFLMLCW